MLLSKLLVEQSELLGTAVEILFSVALQPRASKDLPGGPSQSLPTHVLENDRPGRA